MDFRIGGIVDENTISFLRELGISQFKFDLRPWSLSFTPLRVIRECIEKKLFSNDKIFICFENDSELTILESIKIISEGLLNKNLYLEFYNNKLEISKVNKLNQKFYWHLVGDSKRIDFQKYHNLKGVVIHYDDLLSRLDFNQSYQYLSEIQNLLGQDQSLHLFIDWDFNVDYESLKLLNLKSLSLDINSKVERSYRNANFQLIENYINSFKKGNYENIINQ